ncbi:MAG TPA: hypothetical protein VGQ76_00765 [Thermoanaerobaculia bacterium]|jgi:hypothetical protein|nr:hypothetical protein [Thermoanaerobaculia bacterium]
MSSRILQEHFQPITHGMYGGLLTYAQKVRDGAHILKIVKMMGDTNVKTVEKHYFNFDAEMMADMIEGWEAPTAAALTQPLDRSKTRPSSPTGGRRRRARRRHLKPRRHRAEYKTA